MGEEDKEREIETTVTGMATTFCASMENWGNANSRHIASLDVTIPT